MANQEQNPPQQEQPLLLLNKIRFACAVKELSNTMIRYICLENGAASVDELLSEMTNEDRMEILDALGSICNSIKVDRNNADLYPLINPMFNSQLSYLVAERRIDGLNNSSIPCKVVENRREHGCSGGGGIKPGAKPRHKKHSTSSKQPSVSTKEATKGGSSKAPTGSKTGHSKKRKESSSAMDSNPSQPPVSTPVDTGMHKKDQQVTASFIIHSETASGNDASAASIAEADLGNFAPSDFVPQQQGINEGTKNTSYDHLFAGTDPHVLADQTKYVSEGLKNVLTQPITGKGASSVARQIKEETFSTTKLEDLAKLMSHVQPSFKDLDSPEDDHVIVVDDSNEDENDEVHATINVETKHKLELKKNKAEAEAALLKAQPSFPNVEQLKELLVLNSASSKDGDQSVPSAGQAGTMPAEGEKNTNQATISQHFQRRAEKNAEKENMNNQQPKPTTPPATTIIPPVITTITTQMKSPPQYPQKGSSQPEGENIKKDKCKKAMSLKDAKEVSLESESDDETTHVPGSMVESSKKKEWQKFNFEEAKDEAARHKGEIWKEELIDLLGPKVVNKYYNDKSQYDRYCDKMLNRRAKSRITNCDILTRNGPITLKV
ncbi:hypothetical protein Tco_0809697 [Tanacetum coccineum]